MPLNLKNSGHHSNTYYNMGFASAQGERPEMEDNHRIVHTQQDDPKFALYSVFDGHGSDRVSHYASQHILQYIINDAEYQAGRIAEGLQAAFVSLDAAIFRDVKEEDDGPRQGGSTAVVSIIREEEDGCRVLYVANAGDSRAILLVGRDTLDTLVVPMTRDHVAAVATEEARVVAAEGYVTHPDPPAPPRVNGALVPSRGFGDHEQKTPRLKPEDQAVSSKPEVKTRTLGTETMALILCCDGVYETMDRQDVGEFVLRSIAGGASSEETAIALVTEAHRRGSHDNLSAVIVVFKNKSWDSPATHMKQHVDALDRREARILLEEDGDGEYI